MAVTSNPSENSFAGDPSDYNSYGSTLDSTNDSCFIGSFAVSPDKFYEVVRIMTILYIPLSVLIFLLNITVMLVIITQRLTSQDNKFIFILLMCCSDALMGVSGFCFSIFLDFSASTASAIVISVLVIYNACEVLTVICVLGLTFDSYLHVTRPLHYHSIVTSGRLRGFLAVSLCYVLVDAVGYTLTSHPDVYCALLGVTNNKLVHTLQVFYINIMHIFLPLLVVSILQVKMLVIAYRHHKAIHAQTGLNGRETGTGMHAVKLTKAEDKGDDRISAKSPTNGRNSDNIKYHSDQNLNATNPTQRQPESGSKSSRQAETSSSSEGPLRQQGNSDDSKSGAAFRGAITVGIILSTLIICWVPKTILNFLNPFSSQTTAARMYAYEVSMLLYMAKSLINPFIYSLRVTSIRQAYTAMWNRVRRCNQD